MTAPCGYGQRRIIGYGASTIRLRRAKAVIPRSGISPSYQFGHRAGGLLTGWRS